MTKSDGGVGYSTNFRGGSKQMKLIAESSIFTAKMVWPASLLTKCVETSFFVLCPSHVGVLGNEAAAAAYDSSITSFTEVPLKDCYPMIQSKVKHKWKDEWLAIGTNKL